MATSGYQDIISKIKHKYNALNPALSKELTKESQFMNNLELQPLNTMSCPGCTEFYYLNKNILDNSVHSIPVLVLSPTKKFEDSKAEIIFNIVALLNSKGGVIVYGC